MDADPMFFHVAASERDGCTVLVLAGELDISSTGSLETAIHEQRPIASALFIDVAGVTFIDSSGLRVLLTARDAALEDTGRTVELVGVPPRVRKLLELSGLVDMFSFGG